MSYFPKLRYRFHHFFHVQIFKKKPPKLASACKRVVGPLTVWLTNRLLRDATPLNFLSFANFVDLNEWKRSLFRSIYNKFFIRFRFTHTTLHRPLQTVWTKKRNYPSTFRYSIPWILLYNARGTTFSPWERAILEGEGIEWWGEVYFFNFTRADVWR